MASSTLFSIYNPICMKTSFTGFLPASTGVHRPSCPYAIRFVSAAKTLWGWFVLLKQVLEGKIHSFTYPRGDNLLSNGQNNSAQAVGLLELKKCSSTSATGHSQYQTYAWWKTPWNPSSFPCFKGLALSVGTLPWSQSGANWAKSDTAAPSKTGSKSQRKHRPNLATKYSSFVMCFLNHWQVISPDVPLEQPC